MRKVIRPVQVELWIHNVIEINSDDTFLNGAHDEIYMTGTCFDSSSFHKNEAGVTVALVYGMDFPNLDLAGDINTGLNYEEGRPAFPLFTMALSLQESPVFPRTIAAVINVVEEDQSGSLLEELKKMDLKYREEVIRLVAEKGSEAVGALGAIASPAAAAVASQATAGIMLAIARYAVSSVFDAIISGLENEVLHPILLSLEIPNAEFDFADGRSTDLLVTSGIKSLNYFGGQGGNNLHVFYDWRILRKMSVIAGLDEANRSEFVRNIGGVPEHMIQR